ncbi:family 2 glycosyl transferase [Gracilibacillus halophilus YIM-C55.5]|uniref:Family 2 glycosyl transferase n=1 Tax=Gracilibacillus halophilus YIM-C55.5 TaxID=1308866 RepID=N4WQ83_9BACI|nr:glycosyltransferase family A protein [Gracilibacillus halophilus]ENH96605.1 family 2 glycosyl transferase [Gracilibacillus halophilus YIM-C55.5]
MADVTVVLPLFNKAQYVAETIASLRRQTTSNWKLLVVDDASTDRSLEFVKAHAPSSKTTIIEKRTNTGICDVLNTALRVIDTPFFLQVDGDDWIEPETIEVMLNEMKCVSDHVGLCYANTMHWHEANGSLQLNKVQRHHQFLDRYDFVTYDPMVQPRFYRTSAVKAVGGWNIDSLTGGRYMEDRRMLLQLLDEYTFHYIDRDLYHFRYHQTNLSLDQNATIYNQIRKMESEKALIRWGDQYRLEMVGSSDLWQSVQLIPKRKGVRRIWLK